MLAQISADAHSTVPNLGASGAIAAVMGAFIVTYPRDRIKAVLFIFIFVKITFIPAALLITSEGFVFGALTGRLSEASSRWFNLTEPPSTWPPVEKWNPCGNLSSYPAPVVIQRRPRWTIRLRRRQISLRTHLPKLPPRD